MSEDNPFQFQPRRKQSYRHDKTWVVSLCLIIVVPIVLIVGLAWLTYEPTGQKKINVQYSILQDEFNKGMAQRQKNTSSSSTEAIAIHQEEIIQQMEILIQECQQKYHTEPRYLKPSER